MRSVTSRAVSAQNVEPNGNSIPAAFPIATSAAMPAMVSSSSTQIRL